MMADDVQMPVGVARMPMPTKMFEVKDGNDALILRCATVRATKGTKVFVETPHGSYVIDKVQLDGSGRITIRCRDI